MWGSLQDLSIVFAFADVAMALVNLAALAMLFKVGLPVLQDFDTQIKVGQVPVFDPEKFADLRIDRQAWVFDEPVIGEAVPARA